MRAASILEVFGAIPREMLYFVIGIMLGVFLHIQYNKFTTPPPTQKPFIISAKEYENKKKEKLIEIEIKLDSIKKIVIYEKEINNVADALSEFGIDPSTTTRQ